MEPAALIRTARQEAGLTQAQLARLLGRSQATVAALERPGANPTVATLNEVLAASGHRLDLAAVPHRTSVDETLIARNLKMTPAQRLKAFETAHREVAELRGLMSGARSDAA